MDLQAQKTSRVVKWLLFPMTIIDLILFVIYPEMRTSALVFLALNVFGLIFYYSKSKISKDLAGIPKGNKIFSGIFAGIGVAIMFVVLNKIVPAVSIGYPVLPSTIAYNLRFFFICINAPITEECAFRGVLRAFLIRTYNLKKGTANVIQGILFSLTHLLAYGVVLGQLQYWSEAFGQFTAVMGSFITAGILGIIFGAMVSRKENNILATILAHAIINFSLFTASIVVFT